MAKSINVEVEDRVLSLSNLDKVFWPAQGLSKNDLIQFYNYIAPYILKYLLNRPLVFVRYPNGINSKHFYQKNAPAGLPEWFKTFHWENSDGKITSFILTDEKAHLIWLANQACIEIHPWLSSIEAINNPDYVVFDLDPSEGNTFPEVVKVALLIKKLLAELDLKAWIKTSGATGLHIYLPVINKYSYEDIRIFGEKVAAIVNSAIPELTTIERKVDKRGKRIYIDYLQNVRGQTICAPYSVRAVEGAVVSTPLKWDEIAEITPQMFNIKNIHKRLEGIGDIFQPVLTEKQHLEPALKKLGIESLSAH